MNTFLGLLIIAVGSFGQSSAYVPIRRVKQWSWESFWLVQGIFAWLVFPLAGALAAVPSGNSFFALLGAGGALKAVVYGALWGVGGLTFGLSMRYLGVALGQSVSLGTCSAFGTLLPALFAGGDLLHGDGLLLLLGVCVTLAGIAVIGYAGSLRARNMSEEQKRAAVRDFALTKGLLVALLAGVMSACFALGLDAGAPVRAAMQTAGADALVAGLPVILLVTFGGFLTNAAYCLRENRKNRTGGEYMAVKGRRLTVNLLFCALAAVLRTRNGKELSLRHACPAGLLVEHPDVAQRALLQLLGHRPQRVEGQRRTGGLDARAGTCDSFVFHLFPLVVLKSAIHEIQPTINRTHRRGGRSGRIPLAERLGRAQRRQYLL